MSIKGPRLPFPQLDSVLVRLQWLLFHAAASLEHKGKVFFGISGDNHHDDWKHLYISCFAHLSSSRFLQHHLACTRNPSELPPHPPQSLSQHRNHVYSHSQELLRPQGHGISTAPNASLNTFLTIPLAIPPPRPQRSQGLSSLPRRMAHLWWHSKRQHCQGVHASCLGPRNQLLRHRRGLRQR